MFTTGFRWFILCHVGPIPENASSEQTAANMAALYNLFVYEGHIMGNSGLICFRITFNVFVISDVP